MDNFVFEVHLTLYTFKCDRKKKNPAETQTHTGWTGRTQVLRATNRDTQSIHWYSDIVLVQFTYKFTNYLLDSKGNKLSKQNQ